METSRRLLRYKEIVVALVMAPLLAGCAYQGPLVFGEVHEGAIQVLPGGREAVLANSGLHLRIVKGIGRASQNPGDTHRLELLVTNRGSQTIRLDGSSFSFVMVIQAVSGTGEVTRSRIDEPGYYAENMIGREIILAPHDSTSVVFLPLYWGLARQRYLLVAYAVNGRSDRAIVLIDFPVSGRYLAPLL